MGRGALRELTQPLRRSINTRTWDRAHSVPSTGEKGGTHAWNRIDRDPDPSSLRSIATLVAQSRLRLCADRRTGTYPLYCCHSPRSRPDLINQHSSQNEGPSPALILSWH